MSTSVLSAERIPSLLHTEEPLSPTHRSYFSELIQALFSRDLDSQCKPVMFTSPNSGAGVSFVSSYVATELAVRGGRVLLADVQALTSLGRRSIGDPMKYPERVDSSHLWVLGAKQALPRVLENRRVALSSTALLGALREDFTHIVLDAPALSVSDDALAWATAVHGTVLIAQAGATAKHDIIKAHQSFVSLGGRVLGSVYNARLGGSSTGGRA